MFEPRIVVVEPGPEFRSRYEVLEELGKGRFGVVHKVVDKKKNQKLAAKFIKCRTSKDRDKVQDEIDIMNLLRHQKLLQLAAAFDNPREMVMIMEYISGGELFERVVADDFTLTEKDCILFMRQICEGVAYMHSQNIVHLDLKPENIMCHTRTSHEIKIIDFGLAQKINPKEPVRVLFGTPEFIPPEIINYEPIGVESDMWSIGVICYVLLSGLSPFMGDNDSETFANITRADYDFEDEAFNTISQNARDFIGALLVKRKEERMSAEQCLKHVWLDPETHQETVVLCTDKLKKFIIRRKWQKTGNAIRALGRMATLSASRRNSANSSPNTPRPSITGTTLPRMSSLNEENAALNTSFDIINASKDDLEKTCRDIESFISQNGARNLPTTKSVEDVRTPTNKTARTRACSERSDSGISDCFTHPTSSSCTSTPLLGRKFRINEEVEDAEEEKIFSTSTTLVLSRNNSFNGGRKGYKVLRSDSTDDIDDQREFLNGKKPPIGLSLRLCDKIETFSNASKAKSVTASDSLKRLPIYTSRTVAGTIRKLNTTPTTPDKSLVHDITKKHSFSENNDNDDSRSDITPNGNKHASRVERILEKLSINDNVISSGRTTVTPVRCRSPSPSILRKAQAVAAKNDSFHNGHDVMDTPPKFNSIKISCPPSPLVDRKDKPKSESFQKAAAFWNSPKT